MTGTFDITEIERRLSNVVLYGRIEEARYGNPPEARVRIGDLLTGWLRMGSQRAGPDRAWWPYEIGEEVAVIAPSGNLAQGVILCALYNGVNSAVTASPDIHRNDFANGSFIEHNRETGSLTINATGDVDLIAGGDIAIRATGNITINGARIDLN